MTRTLLVDDNTSFRTLMKDVLGTRFPSMVIAEAANSNEAMHQMCAAPPDIVLMDIELHDESGLVLLKRIKKGFARITVIMLTDCDSIEFQEEAARCGADYFFSKVKSKLDDVFSLVESLIPHVEKVQHVH